MPSLRTEDAFTSTATTTSTSCATTITSKSLLFALLLALHALILCVILVVVVALLLLSAAAVVILLPVASACLLCATVARQRLLVPSVPPCRPRDDENRGGDGVRQRKQDCVEVDRAEAAEPPAGSGSFGDGGAASSFRSSSFDEEFSGRWDWDDDDEQQGRFFFVDTSSYCRTFYDLLAFWRSMERKATRSS